MEEWNDGDHHINPLLTKLNCAKDLLTWEQTEVLFGILNFKPGSVSKLNLELLDWMSFLHLFKKTTEFISLACQKELSTTHVTNTCIFMTTLYFLCVPSLCRQITYYHHWSTIYLSNVNYVFVFNIALTESAGQQKHENIFQKKIDVDLLRYFLKLSLWFT